MFQLGLFLRALRPARTGLRPARFTRAMLEFTEKKKNYQKNNIFFIFTKFIFFAVFVFSFMGLKMLVNRMQICAHVFIDRPQNCAQTSFRSCAGLRPNFGHSRSKLCPIMCRSRTKLCPNFGRPRARLCPISFAPCPFPNLAGTLEYHQVRPPKRISILL